MVLLDIFGKAKEKAISIGDIGKTQLSQLTQFVRASPILTSAAVGTIVGGGLIVAQQIRKRKAKPKKKRTTTRRRKRTKGRMPKVDFPKRKTFTFQRPDMKKFPALELCYAVAKKGGTHPACLTSANEEAVKSYLDGKIGFTGIVKVVKKVLSRHKNIAAPSLDEIIYVDKCAKEEVRSLC